MKKHYKRYIGLAWVLLMWSLVGYQAIYANFSPEAKRARNEVKAEFSLIKLLPGAKVDDFKCSYKNGPYVSADYVTLLSYSEIRSHYDQELAKHGWQFFGEKRFLDWGRDFGGKSAKYRKGDYEFTLQYAGEDAEDYGWTYAIRLSRDY